MELCDYTRCLICQPILGMRHLKIGIVYIQSFVIIREAAFFHCQLCQLLPDRSGHHVLELYSKAAVQRKEIHYTSEQTAYSFG